MNASRVYVPISQDLRHWDFTSPVTRTASSGRDLVCRRGVAEDGAGTSPPFSADTAFYPDSSVEALRVERIRLFAICRAKGLIAS